MTATPTPLEGINSGSAVSCLCPAGKQLRLGMDVCAIVLSKDSADILMPPPGNVFIAPYNAQCCIVSLREFRVKFGMKDLVGYRAAGAPGRIFRLGFFGEVTLKFAHSRGFSNLLRRSTDISADTLIPMLETELRSQITSAITSVLGTQPADYQDILAHRGQLQIEIEKALFWQLYTYGLCIKPHSLSIQGFSKPVI